MSGADVLDIDDAPPLDAAGGEAIAHLMRPIAPLLAHPKATEVCINRPREAWLEAGSEWTCMPLPELDFAALRSLGLAVATFTSQGVGKTRPLLSATLPTGERIQVAMPPAVEDGIVSITIRKPNRQILRLDDFTEQGLFSRVKTDAVSCGLVERELLARRDAKDYATFLRLAVRARLNIVVSGATGSGKTTFMKGLMQEVPVRERVITIEDARELFLPSHPNVVHLLYSKGGQGTAKVDSRDLLHSCMRMRPDRIFLSELRGADAFEYIDVAASGHPGSITSTHGGSAADAFQRLMRMVRQSPEGSGMLTEDIKLMLLRAIDVLVQFDRDEGGRFVSELYYRPDVRRAADASFLTLQGMSGTTDGIA
jgi:type IV secretion system protein VirB11